MTVPTMVVGHGSTSPDRLDLFGRIVVLGWWAIYLLLSPFYVFSSGNPQPADLFLAALSPIVLMLLAFRVHVNRDILVTGLAFLTWIIVVNGFWWAQYYKSDFLINVLFYVYNMFVFFCVISIHQVLKEQFISTTRIALMIIVGVQLGTVLLGFDFDGLRRSGTFNNPNQLGYWGLLIGCSIVALRGRERLTASDMIALLAAGYITAESLSRAATYAFFVLLAIAVACQGVSRRGLILILMGAALLTVLWSAHPNGLPGVSEGGVVERFNKRLGFRQDQEALGGERGYDRILDYPEHLIFGAGEGEHARFSDAGDLEFHSTFGILLFHYGVIGSALFGMFLMSVSKRTSWAHLALLVPIGLYGVTHNGLRFTLFWIFLGLIVAMSGRVRQGEVGSAQQRPAAWPTGGRERMVRRGS